jgi:hypothetical protein
LRSSASASLPWAISSNLARRRFTTHAHGARRPSRIGLAANPVAKKAQSKSLDGGQGTLPLCCRLATLRRGAALAPLRYPKVLGPASQTGGALVLCLSSKRRTDHDSMPQELLFELSGARVNAAHRHIWTHLLSNLEYRKRFVPATWDSSAPRAQRPHCLDGHVGLELRNVVAEYPFESSRGFPGSEPNSGHGDHSRLSCNAGDTQLGTGSAGIFSMRSARTLAIMRRRREGTNWPRSLSIRR